MRASCRSLRAEHTKLKTQYEEALTETVKLNQKLNAVEVGVMSPSDSQKELPIAPATEGESEQPEQAETTKEATKEATKEPGEGAQ